MTLRAEKALVALLLAALLHPAFQGVAVLVSARSVLPPAWLLTPLDRWLPVVPAAVWVYLSWYPAAAVVLLAGRATFRRAALAYVVAFAVCVGVYPLFPLGISRPELTHQDGWSANVLAAVYAADRPVNLFPSFHAAVAAILFRLRPPSRLLRVGLQGWMVAICIACVLTKQHYVADVVAGLAVGWGALTLVHAAAAWRLPSLRPAAEGLGRNYGSAGTPDLLDSH